MLLCCRVVVLLYCCAHLHVSLHTPCISLFKLPRLTQGSSGSGGNSPEAQAQAILENLVRSEPSIKANLLAALVEASVSEKQGILEETDLVQRLGRVHRLVRRQVCC